MPEVLTRRLWKKEDKVKAQFKVKCPYPWKAKFRPFLRDWRFPPWIQKLNNYVLVIFMVTSMDNW